MCLLLGTMALLLSRTPRQRVYYQDGQILVNVRYPGQWNRLTEFITPTDPEVQRVLPQTDYDIWHCLDFVCKNINYKRDIGEHWQFPYETLARGLGDCEDSTFLFVSLAQNFAPDAIAVLGDYRELGHAWGAKNGFIYETTYTRAQPVPDPQNYCPYVYFNDQDIIELWPGALDEVLGLNRNEAVKLNLIAQALGG